MLFDSGLLDPVSGEAIRLEPGAYKISRQKLAGPGTHYGVLVLSAETGYRPLVYHQQTDGHKVVSVAEFAQEHFVHFNNKVVGAEAAAAIQRIRRLLWEQRPFNILSNNCEHAATEAVEGKSESSQVKGLLTLGFIGVCIWALAKAG